MNRLRISLTLVVLALLLGTLACATFRSPDDPAPTRPPTLTPSATLTPAVTATPFLTITPTLTFTPTKATSSER